MCLCRHTSVNHQWHPRTPITLLALSAVPVMAFAQTVIRQPVVYTQPAGIPASDLKRPDLGAPVPPSDSSSWFSQLGLNAQFGQAQVGAAGEIYRFDVYGAPHCEPDATSTPANPKPDVCTPHVVFSPTISSNILDPIASSLSSIRDYLLSQSGSPATARLAWLQGTTKRGDVKQTWGAYQASASLRAIPAAGSKGEFEPAGALTAGATFELNLEFDATKIDSKGASVYPGSIYVSLSPTAVIPFGGEVRAAIFAGSSPTFAVFGLDYRIGFQLKGANPTSFNVVGTLATRGFKAAQSSVGVAVSKVVGQ